MNFLRQGFRKLSSDRQTYIYTYIHRHRPYKQRDGTKIIYCATSRVVNGKHRLYSFLLSSLEAAFRVADDADRSVSGANNKSSRRLKHKACDSLAESLLLGADQLECVGDHVDGQDIASCRATVEVLVIRRYLDTHIQRATSAVII